MAYVVPETDRAAELLTLRSELRRASERRRVVGKEGQRFLDRQIARINRDITRNLEKLEAIL